MRRFWAPGLGRHLVAHPLDAVLLVRAGWKLRSRHWWRTAPFLPLPSREYWEFRMTTLGGSSNLRPTPAAMIDAAKWSIRQREGR
ncbi:MAG: hypothetical protein HIU84_12355 [Acidobacteria bacterium]|nr:hypothetical protein [Acidobacteriota bacterium]